MEAVFIDVARETYSPREATRTLTVGQLIEILEEFDQDSPVIVRHDNGYTYGTLAVTDLSCEDIPRED